ncbi:unnamed protein product [Victoria cruziana]
MRIFKKGVDPPWNFQDRSIKPALALSLLIRSHSLFPPLVKLPVSFTVLHFSKHLSNFLGSRGQKHSPLHKKPSETTTARLSFLEEEAASFRPRSSRVLVPNQSNESRSKNRKQSTTDIVK